MKTIDPLLSISTVDPLDELTNKTLSRPRFILALLSLFAVVAFLLAAVGIYGVISYSVTQRKREIGIRMALGAQHNVVARMVLRQGSLLALIGVTIGLGVSLALTRLVRSLLFGVAANDPMTFLVVSLLMLTVAALASFVPARRATRVDPILALRSE
jgi:ABC-type antimicrobial peptide transport system permease subunit